MPLVRRSHELWREIERDTGARLMTESGIVILARGSSPFLEETRAAARAYEIEHRDLTNDELRARFPMFAADELTEAYYEPGAGYVRPEAAVAAQLGLARRRGAELRLGERVARWSASPEGVTVTTVDGRYGADQLLLCAGAWIGELFPPGGDIFAVYRQVLYWFPIREGYAQLRDMPAFVWDFGGDRQGFVHLNGFYGFPALDGPEGGVKVATESYRRTASPDGRRHAPAPADVDRMYTRCVAPQLPWLGPVPLRAVSCLYTCSRGSRFVIDSHPEHDRVLIVSACSGHGFKHSPAIGEAVSQRLTGRHPTSTSALSASATRSGRTTPTPRVGVSCTLHAGQWTKGKT